jgi:hypothetical protein
MFSGVIPSTRVDTIYTTAAAPSEFTNPPDICRAGAVNPTVQREYRPGYSYDEVSSTPDQRVHSETVLSKCAEQPMKRRVYL